MGDRKDWNSGVFGCMSDIKACVCGLCCLPCLTCRVAKGLGEDCVICNGLCCFPESIIGLRATIRARNNIRGSICNDICWIACCMPCVVCQMERELKAMGVETEGCI